jgi:hypothetical protein
VGWHHPRSAHPQHAVSHKLRQTDVAPRRGFGESSVQPKLSANCRAPVPGHLGAANAEHASGSGQALVVDSFWERSAARLARAAGFFRTWPLSPMGGPLGRDPTAHPDMPGPRERNAHRAPFFGLRGRGPHARS